jgi:hypothetical protein
MGRKIHKINLDLCGFLFLFLMVKIGIQLPQDYDQGGFGFSHCGHPNPCDDQIFEMNFGKKKFN